MASEEMIFLIFFREFILSVAMATNQFFSFIPQTAEEELIFYYFFGKFCLFVAMGTDQIKKLQQTRGPLVL